MLLGCCRYKCILEHDEATTRTRVSLDAKAEFENPAGFIQGGILTAMLDDTMGPAIWFATGDCVPSHNQHERVSPRRCAAWFDIRVKRASYNGRTIAFLEAQLAGEDKKLVACATAKRRARHRETLIVQMTTNALSASGARRWRNLSFWLQFGFSALDRRKLLSNPSCAKSPSARSQA